jgi:hypothetical protein
MIDMIGYIIYKTVTTWRKITARWTIYIYIVQLVDQYASLHLHLGGVCHLGRGREFFQALLYHLDVTLLEINKFFFSKKKHLGGVYLIVLADWHGYDYKASEHD